MKKVISILIIFTFAGISALYGQKVSTSKTVTGKYSRLSQENIFIHYNSSVLFAGEYLFYKVYAINSRIDKLSKISEIAYVELIGEDGERVFQHKIALDDGIGWGDYFVTTGIASGNYKLIAYTQWMKNVAEDNFFQADISILNPYRGNQSSILAGTMAGEASASETNTTQKQVPENQTQNKNSQKVKLIVNGQKFDKRKEVLATLKTSRKDLGYGNYSLSVKKIDAFHPAPRPTTVNYTSMFDNGISGNKLTKVTYLPELSGELVTGRVIRKGSNVPAKGQSVAISIPGKDFFFLVDVTDENGEFQFSLDINYDKEDATFQVLGKGKEEYRILLDKKTAVDYSNLSFHSFKIGSEMKEMILERSINNQVENGYYSVKPDTLKPIKTYKPFTYYEKTATFNLDEYTRFPTMTETFIEVIRYVWSRRGSDGEMVFKVKNHEYDTETDFLPLVFLDGVLLQKHEQLLEYDPTKVKTIRVIRDKYKFGTQNYHGVIVVETFEGDYTNEVSSDYLAEMTLVKPRFHKRYFRQSYDENTAVTSNRIPDFRAQLLWEPSIVLVEDILNIQFFTSDITGDYELCLEGFTVEGKPISIREVIRVE